jgi:hypothetical protein
MSVGNTLAAAKLFLQVPNFDRRSLLYVNPQDLMLPDLMDIDMEPSIMGTFQAAHHDHVKEISFSEIESLLDHTPQSRSLRESYTGDRIRTQLLKYVSTRFVDRPLK